MTFTRERYALTRAQYDAQRKAALALSAGPDADRLVIELVMALRVGNDLWHRWGSGADRPPVAGLELPVVLREAPSPIIAPEAAGYWLIVHDDVPPQRLAPSQSMEHGGWAVVELLARRQGYDRLDLEWIGPVYKREQSYLHPSTGLTLGTTGWYVQVAARGLRATAVAPEDQPALAVARAALWAWVTEADQQ